LGRRSLFLHLGTHKTGTTSLQTFLGTHAAKLRERGVLYPTTGWRDGHLAHHNIAWELGGDRRFDPGFGTIAALRTEIAGHDGNVILSSEDFTGAVRDPASFAVFLRALRADGFDVTLVLFLRNQADYAASLYLTLIQLGFDRDFRDYLDTVATAGELRHQDWFFPFRYDRFIETLQTLPAEIAVRSYDTARRGSLLSDFLAACTVDGAAFADQVLPRENLRPPLWAGMRVFHRARFGGGAAPEAVFAAAENALPRGLPYRASERARFSECFTESNDKLCAHWGIMLDSLLPGAALDDRPLTSMSDLFSSEFHALLAVMGSLDHVTSIEEELRRQRDSYERTLSWRITSPLRALHARLRKTSPP